MNIEDYITNAVAASRAKSFAESDQLTLGEIILKIEAIVERHKSFEGKEEATVYYDFEHLFPTKIDSWRGIYAELALNWQTEGEVMRLGDFLKMLKEALGKTFIGYKGGEFVMSKNTPVWVANCGNSGNTAVIDIVDNTYSVIIITGYRKS